MIDDHVVPRQRLTLAALVALQQVRKRFESDILSGQKHAIQLRFGYGFESCEIREETERQFSKRAVLANVPSFRIFGVQEYQNHSFFLQGSIAGEDFWRKFRHRLSETTLSCEPPRNVPKKPRETKDRQ